MSLSLLAGIGAIAAALGPKIKKNKKFDDKVNYEGINSVPLSEIEKRVGVRKDKYGMYTHSAMKKMLQYGRENTVTGKEYKTYEKRINLIMNQQRKSKTEQYKNEGYRSLSDKSKAYIKRNGGFNPSEIVEIVTIHRSFTPTGQQRMINDIMQKTWWGKCANGAPRIKAEPGKNVEYWKMHVPLTYVNSPGDNYQRKMRRGYKRCLKECGHNPRY